MESEERRSAEIKRVDFSSSSASPVPSHETTLPSNNQPVLTTLNVQSFELHNGVPSNHSLTFTKSKIRSDKERLQSIRGRRNYLQLSILFIILLVSVVGTIVLTYIWTSSHEAPFDYAMVFDAGSTHTEMLIYKWQADKFKGTGVVHQVHSCDMPGGIGVVLRADPASSAPAYFSRCLAEGLASIPETRRSHSPLYLAATAGMRIVRSESPVEAQQILGNVTRVLERAAGGERGMLVGVSSVRIISGQEEAVAGWISANYLLKTIFPKPTRLVGMLDMGGASTQLTFVREPGDAPSVFDTSLQLYGARHELYARSYMCFGQSQLLQRYLVLLVQDSFVDTESSILRVQSPCHNAGYNETFKMDSIINVCSETHDIAKVMKLTVILEGSSDAGKCRQRVGTLLDAESCYSKFKSGDCFYPPANHSLNTNFVAVSGLYYVMDYLELLKGNPSIKVFLAAVEKRCNMEWKDIISHSDAAVEYASKVCFNAQYQALLLFDGYGIKEETWKNIDFFKKVNGTSVGWALGFTIRSTNAFPEEPAMEPFSTVVFISVVFLLAICIGVCLTLAIGILVKTSCFKLNHVSVK